MTDTWIIKERPGFFGRRRDEKIAALNQQYGVDGWQLRHVLPITNLEELVLHERTTEPSIALELTYDFVRACKELYEESYYRFLSGQPRIVDEICKYWNVYDNATSNVDSGLDYTRQEAYSTHIQDIAIRNALVRLGRWFSPLPSAGLMQVRGPESIGYRLGLNPGQVPFFDPAKILQPSLAPTWAGRGSVEDLWQSNKLLLVRQTT